MTTQVFPTLIGQGFSVNRTPMWYNKKNVSVAGLEAVFKYWSVPRFQWDLTFDVLRAQVAFQELQQLMGFFNLRSGGGDVFLYADQTQNSVSGQQIGIGTGAEDSYQLVAAFGGFTMPILAPNAVSAVYLDSVEVDPADYTVNDWDTSTPGLLVFDSPPADSAVITADYSFYFPCRFVDDAMNFSMFMEDLYNAKKVSLKSIKGTA